METINEVLTNAERAARQLKQNQINTTPPEIFKQQTYNTNEMKMTDTMNKTNMNNNIQTNTTNDYPPTWKRLAKSFVAMMIVFLFVYTGFNILTWLYDTLGMEHVMPTLIGIVLWIAVYDHMYGVPSKAPRV